MIIITFEIFICSFCIVLIVIACCLISTYLFYAVSDVCKVHLQLTLSPEKRNIKKALNSALSMQRYCMRENHYICCFTALGRILSI